MIFQNREEAGKKLALRLIKYIDKPVLIIALPRGGVPVGSQIAKFLKAPLDILIVRKIGAPLNPEMAIGAIAPGGIWLLNKLLIQKLRIPQEQIDEIAKKEITEMIRRQIVYRGNLPPPKINGKIIILVDDGIATGATIKAAIKAIQKQKPSKLILAVPVCAADVVEDIKTQIDEFIYLDSPKNFLAVGASYKNFAQITDEEVKTLLQKIK